MKKQLDSFRQEVKPGGISSYPHPFMLRFCKFKLFNIDNILNYISGKIYEVFN